MNRLEKALVIALVAVLMLGSLPLAGHAGALGEYAYVVNTSSLNLRSGPGLNYPILGSAGRNEMVRLLGLPDAGGWVSVIIVADGTVGFMDSRYLSATPNYPVQPTPAPIYNQRAVVRNPVATQFLNLRQFPSYSAPVLGIFYNGTQCTVLSESGGWYNVRMDNGLVGYFRGEFLSFDLTPVPPPAPPSQGTARIVSSGGRVNLRQGPSYAYPVIASYYPGKTVTVYSKGAGFWQISVDGLMGYMDSRFLSVSGGGGSTGTANAQVKSGARLNLRQQPNTSAKVLGTYSAGTQVVVKRQGLEWCYVSLPSTGATGYFMTRYLTLRGLPEIPTKVVKNSGSYVNLRNRPSKSGGEVNVRVPHNSVVTMLSPGGEWSRVRFGTVNGYMMSGFLK